MPKANEVNTTNRRDFLSTMVAVAGTAVVAGTAMALTPFAAADALFAAREKYKKIVVQEMRRRIDSREAHASYERWFMQPIPPKNTAMHLPMNYFLKDFW